MKRQAAAADLAAAIAELRANGASDLAARLDSLMSSPWQARQARLSVRDRAIADAMDLFAPHGRTVAAKMLAAALDRYSATAWRNDRIFDALPDNAEPTRRALHGILRLNEGKTIAWRQLLNAADGRRTPTR